MDSSFGLFSGRAFLTFFASTCPSTAPSNRVDLKEEFRASTIVCGSARFLGIPIPGVGKSWS